MTLVLRFEFMDTRVFVKVTVHVGWVSELVGTVPTCVNMQPWAILETRVNKEELLSPNLQSWWFTPPLHPRKLKNVCPDGKRSRKSLKECHQRKHLS